MGRGPHTDNILLKKSNKETREREKGERTRQRRTVLTLECVQEGGEVLAGGEGEEKGELCTYV